MILGNVGADGELRFTQGGQAVLNVRVATTESYLDKDKVRVERTDWHSVTIWGKRGEALAKILTKGTRAFFEGSLRTSSYDDKEGTKRYKTEIVATNVILCGGKGSDAPQGEQHDGDGGRAQKAGGEGYGYPASSHTRNDGGPRGGGSQSNGGASVNLAGVRSAGDFEVRFGRDKGKPISLVDDLSWLRGVLEKDLADPSKARFADNAKSQLVAIDEENARRTGGGAGGGGYAPRGGARPAPQQEAPPPADEYDAGGGFGNDDDIPF
jgi:single-strand DNA-binding protein